MIVNAYAVLGAFCGALQLLFGFLILGLGWNAWRRQGAAITGEGRQFHEDRSYLVLLLALVLLVLNVAAWPFFYLVLQSYIPEWPGVMCIYGVTRIGTGSENWPSYLPGLVQSLQVLKPVLVFLSGAWLVLYLINRRTRTAPLQGRVLLFALVVGAVAVTDAAAEESYLMIPKKEHFLACGCCTDALDESTGSARFVPRALLTDQTRPWLYEAFYGVNGALVLALLAQRRRTPMRLALLLLGALVALPISGIFLTEIAAPRLLHLPEHHCAYDLFPGYPAALTAIGLFFLGTFAVGWGCLAGWLGRNQETEGFLRRTVGGLLWLGALSYLVSVLLITVELALA